MATNDTSRQAGVARKARLAVAAGLGLVMMAGGIVAYAPSRALAAGGTASITVTRGCLH